MRLVKAALVMIVICLALSGLAAYAFSREVPQYTADALIVTTHPPPLGDLFGSELAAYGSAPENDVAKITALSFPGTSPAQIADAVEIEPRGTDGVISIRATTTAPNRAVAITNQFSEDYASYKTRSEEALVSEVKSDTFRNRNAFSPREFEDRLVTLGQLEDLAARGTSVARYATLPTSTSSPSTALVAALALGLSLALGGSLLALSEKRRRTRLQAMRS